MQLGRRSPGDNKICCALVRLPPVMQTRFNVFIEILLASVSIQKSFMMSLADTETIVEVFQEWRLVPVKVVLSFKHRSYQKPCMAVETCCDRVSITMDKLLPS